MASSSHSLHDKKNHAYIYAHVKNVSSVLIMIVVMIMLFLTLMPCMHHLALHMPMVGIDLGAMFIMLFLMRLGMHLMAQLCFYHTYDASSVLMCKNDKVVARNLGPKCKRDKTCIWVPKSYVTNLVGPNKSWVSKTQA
jgi:hypothetical protein